MCGTQSFNYSADVGAIAGGTCGGVVVLCGGGTVTAVIIIIIIIKKRKQKDQSPQTNPCSVRMNADTNMCIHRHVFT